MKILVTGGAGFIGSFLTEFLIKEGHSVQVLDNLSSGKLSHLHLVQDSPRFEFVEGSITDQQLVDRLVAEKDLIFHLCDNSDIQFAAKNPRVYLDQNVMGCFYVLEAMRKHGVKKLVFPSSTTVIGDATVVPTPENYGPLMPMNIYGAGKLACEALISSYCHTFDLQAWVFRFVGIIGHRMDHGVLHDFVKKLNQNPKSLTILGDGSQKRSFVIVEDCIDAIWTSLASFNRPMNLIHIGNVDQVSILEAAGAIESALHLNHVEHQFTGGNRGWRGDALTNMLACDSLDQVGWKPKLNSIEAVKNAAERIQKAYFL